MWSLPVCLPPSVACLPVFATTRTRQSIQRLCFFCLTCLPSTVACLFRDHQNMAVYLSNGYIIIVLVPCLPSTVACLSTFLFLDPRTWRSIQRLHLFFCFQTYLPPVTCLPACLPVSRPLEHTASVKDLKTRVITPAKDAGTPQKGLLKVGGGGSVAKPMRPTAGRKDTPHNKRAAHFF